MYAPQKTASDDIYNYSKALGADSLAMIRQLNATFPSNAALLQVCSTPHGPHGRCCSVHDLLTRLSVPESYECSLALDLLCILVSF